MKKGSMSKVDRLELLVEESAMGKTFKKITRKYLDHGFESLTPAEADAYHHRIIHRISDRCRVCMERLTLEELRESIISNAYCESCTEAKAKRFKNEPKNFELLALSSLAHQISQLKIKYGQDELWKFSRGWKDVIEEFHTFPVDELGKRLKAKSLEMGIQIKSGPHREGTIGVYHKKVAEAVQDDLIEELSWDTEEEEDDFEGMTL